MDNFDAYLSEQAREEFQSLFDDEPSHPRLRQLVGEALVRGWSNNKDKPFWALAIVVSCIGRAGARTSCRRTKDGLDIVAEPADALWQRLRAASADVDHDAFCGIECTQDRLRLHFDGTRYTLTLTRLRILKKIAEFLLVCDDFSRSKEVLGLFETLSSCQREDVEIVKDAIRSLSRIAYAYRTKHFHDTGAQSAFGLLMRFVSTQSAYEIDGDSVMALWAWEENQKFKSYSNTFFAFSDFYADLADLMTRRALIDAHDVLDPVIQGDLEDGDDPESLLIQAESLLIEGSGDICDDAFEQGADQPVDDETVSPLERFDTAPMRLLSGKEPRLVGQLARLGRFGFAFPRASLRLIAFHPVQSGLSNALRTGKSKLSLAERLTCVEAVSYRDIDQDVKDLANRMNQLLKAALARRGEPVKSNPALDEIYRAGIVILDEVRAKRGGKDGKSASAEDWLAVEPALVTTQSLARQFTNRIERAVGHDPTETTLVSWFETDRKTFQRVLSALYGNGHGEAHRAHGAN